MDELLYSDDAVDMALDDEAQELNDAVDDILHSDGNDIDIIADITDEDVDDYELDEDPDYYEDIEADYDEDDGDDCDDYYDDECGYED